MFRSIAALQAATHQAGTPQSLGTLLAVTTGLLRRCNTISHNDSNSNN